MLISNTKPMQNQQHQQRQPRKCIVECNFDLLPPREVEVDDDHTKRLLPTPPLWSQAKQASSQQSQQELAPSEAPPRRGLKRSDSRTIRPNSKAAERIIMKQASWPITSNTSRSSYCSHGVFGVGVVASSYDYNSEISSLPSVAETSVCNSSFSSSNFGFGRNDSSSMMNDSPPSIPTRTRSPCRIRRGRYHCSFENTCCEDDVPSAEAVKDNKLEYYHDVDEDDLETVVSFVEDEESEGQEEDDVVVGSYHTASPIPDDLLIPTLLSPQEHRQQQHPVISIPASLQDRTKPFLL